MSSLGGTPLPQSPLLKLITSLVTTLEDYIKQQQQQQVQGAQEAPAEAQEQLHVEGVDMTEEELANEMQDFTKETSNNSNEKEEVVIYVSGGSFSQPYYNFYNKDEVLFAHGRNPLELDDTKKYIFKRLNNAKSHPFWMGNGGWNRPSNTQVSINSKKTHSWGITGDEELTLEFNKNFDNNPHLYYFCTSHKSMKAKFRFTNPDFNKG